MRTSRESLRWVALGILVGVVLVGCSGGGGGSHSNSPPIAVVGAAQTVAKRSLVTLDGSASHDPDGNSITYSWTQTAGPSVVLSSATAVKPQFTAPGVSGSLSFSLTVNDGQLSSAGATTTVTVMNHAPVASAGADVTVAASAPVALDGAGSSDADGDPLTYKWVQTAGPSVSLSSSSSANPTFVSPYNSALPSRFPVHVQDYAPITSSVTYSSAAPRLNDPISVQVISSDPDQHSLTTTYVWTRNGVTVAAATGPNYPLGNQVKNDVIAVMVTVSDGTLSASSNASVTIADSPAWLTGVAPTSASYGPLGRFQVTASHAH